jgi:hypothetical protein
MVNSTETRHGVHRVVDADGVAIQIVADGLFDADTSAIAGKIHKHICIHIHIYIHIHHIYIYIHMHIYAHMFYTYTLITAHDLAMLTKLEVKSAAMLAVGCRQVWHA